MNLTVIGLFNDSAQVQRALERLEDSGISYENIDVTRSPSRSGHVQDDPNEPKEWVGTDKITDNNLIRFFKSLFSGEDDDAPERYAQAVSGGQAVVSVYTTSREEAERAAAILDECGATNVDDVEGRPGQTGTGSSAPPIAPTAAERQAMPDDLSGEMRGDDTSGERGRSQIVSRPVDDDLRLRDEGNPRSDDTDLGHNRPGASGF